jgi:hypothetical protein
MRTTVTLDADTRALVERQMKQRGVSFKQALNDAIRRGLTDVSSVGGPVTRPKAMGAPKTDLTKALQLAGELESEELIGKLRRGT